MLITQPRVDIDIGRSLLLGHFAETPFKQRQNSLQKTYHFTCECQACLENWPLYEDLNHGFENSEYGELSIEFSIAMESEDYWKGLDILRKRMVIISDNLQEPHRLFVENRVAYMQCLRQCYGNLFFMPKIK